MQCWRMRIIPSLASPPFYARMSIPIVDVSGDVSCRSPRGPVTQQIHDAFTAVGFVFITGHGIPGKTASSYALILV